MKNVTYYIIGQSTVKTASKILAYGAFCLIDLACGAFCFTKIWPAAHFFHFFCLNWDAFDLKVLVLSTNSLVVKIIPTPIP